MSEDIEDSLDNLEALNDKSLSWVFESETGRPSDMESVLNQLNQLSPDWSVRTVHGSSGVSLYFVGPNKDGSAYGHSSSLKRAMMIAGIRARRFATCKKHE